LLETFSAKKLRNYYLLNTEEEGERHFKLLLSETDKETLLAILQASPMPAERSTRINENYALFQQLIGQHQNELEAICQGLAKLVIVDVSLDRSQDNPQLIFESMNSTGLELSQADLIRNFILMGLEPKLQTELYKSYWRPMEKGFGQAAYAVHFDAFCATTSRPRRARYPMCARSIPPSRPMPDLSREIREIWSPIFTRMRPTIAPSRWVPNPTSH
jgi:hypothetical protein